MDIINMLINKFKNLDKKVKKLMDIGIKSSFVLCVISTLFLFTYQKIYSTPNLYYIGLSLLQTSLMFVCTFILCGFGFDTIKKELI